jgi:hypothetical protein
MVAMDGGGAEIDFTNDSKRSPKNVITRLKGSECEAPTLDLQVTANGNSG